MMFPKRVYFRSKTHLKNVALLPCQHCGLEGQTQAAHSNWAEHGKAKAKKASDEYTAALCVKHHFEIDQGAHLSKNERIEIWNNAYKKTVNLLKEKNLWPKELTNSS